MSRFDDVMKNVKGRSPGTTEAPPPETPAPKARTGTASDKPPPAPPASPVPRRPGRPPGKKSDPAYEQVTAYVPRELYGGVRSALWNHHGRKEFSALVGELLLAWLDDQPAR